MHGDNYEEEEDQKKNETIMSNGADDDDDDDNDVTINYTFSSQGLTRLKNDMSQGEKRRKWKKERSCMNPDHAGRNRTVRERQRVRVSNQVSPDLKIK